MAEDPFISEYDVRWNDIDANGHLRNTMYSEFAAQTRVNFMMAKGLLPAYLEKEQVGPILFREELIYHREIRVGDQIRVNLLLDGMTRDARKLHLINEIFRSDGIRACTIYTIVSWMDLQKRRIVSPPAAVADVFRTLARSPDYEDI